MLFRSHWEEIFQSDFGWKEVVRFFVHWFGGLAHKIGRDWDEKAWDGFIESTPSVARRLGEAGSALASGLINDYLWWMLAGTSLLLYAVIR